MDNTIDFITISVQKASNTSWTVSNTKRAFADLVLKNAIKKKRTDQKNSKIDAITKVITATPVTNKVAGIINTPQQANLIKNNVAETTVVETTVTKTTVAETTVAEEEIEIDKAIEAYINNIL